MKLIRLPYFIKQVDEGERENLSPAETGSQ